MKTYAMRLAGLAIFATTVTACNGTTTSGFGGFADSAQNQLSSNGITSFASLFAQTTRSDDIPAGGSATYTGYAGVKVIPSGGDLLGLQQVSDVDALGEFRMTATFTPADGNFTATADNFYGSDDAEYGGSLLFTGMVERELPSVADPDGNVGLDGTFSGNLTGTGAYAGSYTNGNLGGGFYQAGDLLLGFGNGDLALTSGTPNDGFGLAIVAEKD